MRAEGLTVMQVGDKYAMSLNGKRRHDVAEKRWPYSTATMEFAGPNMPALADSVQSLDARIERVDRGSSLLRVRAVQMAEKLLNHSSYSLFWVSE